MPQMVSIITASYNVEQYIEETIASVQSQTYQDWEMLITDDASTDNTCIIIEAIAKKDARIKLFKLKQNSGAAVARNYSIQNARGRFHAFIDADDVWFPTKLEVQLKMMSLNNIEVSFSNYIYIDENSKPMNIMVRAIKELTFSKLLKNNYIGNLTGIYDTKYIGKLYCPPILKRQDWCLWLDAVKNSKSVALGIQKPLAKYRIRRESLSRNKIRLLKYNFLVYHNHLNYGNIKSLYFLLIFLFEYFFVRPKYIEKINR